MLKRAKNFYFPNQEGQPYTRSGFATLLKRLQDQCLKANPSFVPFTLRDMRPTAYTAKRERGDTDLRDAMGHSSDKMGNLVYDRRRIRKFAPVE